MLPVFYAAMDGYDVDVQRAMSTLSIGEGYKSSRLHLLPEGAELAGHVVVRLLIASGAFSSRRNYRHIATVATYLGGVREKGMVRTFSSAQGRSPAVTFGDVRATFLPSSRQTPARSKRSPRPLLTTNPV